jgi:hypothetical protein
MTSRDRWTIYPLLFLAIGLGLNANLQNQADHESFDGRIVRCKGLVVVNESGKPVVELTSNKSGAGILEARNGDGVLQVVLTADPPGGVLRMLDVTGKYYQFPSFERRPFPLLPADDANPGGEQPAAKDGKAA